MNIRRTSIASASGLAILTALALTGCGVQQNTSASGTSSPNTVCTGSSHSSAQAPTQLTLALVPSGNSSKLIETVKPLEAALTQRLGIPVTAVITTDYQAAVEAIGSNQAQIGMLPSLQMSQACQKYGAVPALQTLRNGQSTYAAQFFTNDPDKYCTTRVVTGKNGMLYCNGTESGQGPAGLSSIKKMKGATVSLLQAASPAGYIFPVAAMKKYGVSLNDISMTQVTSNNASVLAVYNGDAEVGTSYWDARTVVAQDTPGVAKKLVVFALTDEIPNDGVSISGKLSPAWQKKIANAMKDYAKTSEGVATLTAIYQITGFTDANPAKLQETEQIAASIGLG